MLFSYVTYEVIWWALIGTVLILYAWTAGFDMGIGSLLPFIARTNTERRVLINVIGPTWDGNQVWLIFGGGAIFAVWPVVYATVFSGFYIAMLLVLWTLFLRPVGFEYRAKIKNTHWQSTWDWCLFVGSTVPAIVIGVAFGNLLQGIPMHFTDDFRPFYDGTFWQLLNPFAVLVGIVSWSLFITHGANLLLLRTDGIIYQRCQVASRLGSTVFLLSFIGAGIWIAGGLLGYQLIYSPVDPQAQFFQAIVKTVPAGLLQNYTLHHWMVLAPLFGIFGALMVFAATFIRRTPLPFIGSMLMAVGAILTFGFSLFPFIVPSSTMPNQSLTVWNAASGIYSLAALFWVALFVLPTIGFYTLWVYRKMWSTITTDTIDSRSKELY